MSLCRRCYQEFSGLIVETTLGHKYHERCFRCTDCGNVLKDHGFLIDGDDYYCRSDYKTMFMKRFNLTGAEAEKKIELIFGSFKVVSDKSPMQEVIDQRLKEYGRPNQPDQRPWYLQVLFFFIGCCI